MINMHEKFIYPKYQLKNKFMTKKKIDSKVSLESKFYTLCTHIQGTNGNEIENCI